MSVKQRIFDNYVESIAQVLGIDAGELFERTKVNEITEARQILVHLCNSRNIPFVLIQKYIKRNGLSLSKGTVSYMNTEIKRKLRNDKTVRKLVTEIRQHERDSRNEAELADSNAIDNQADN